MAQEKHEIPQIEIIEKEIKEALSELEQISKKRATHKDACDLEKAEKAIIKATDKLAGLLTAQQIQQSLDSAPLKEEAAKLASALPKNLKNQGKRIVEITPLRGEPIKVEATYYSKKKKRRKRKKKAMKSGLYPGLFLLGIHDHLTPNLSSEISMMATILSSFQETSQVLKDRGLNIDSKKIGEITRRFAKRAEMAKQTQGIEIAETLAGCRVVISTDGGRIRIRKKKRGPKTKKGRNRYTTKWKEPKLIIIYTVNEQGEKESSFLPLIEGTMKGPDWVFSMIKYYLLKLYIKKADKVLFVSDGARWIWNRVPEIAKEFGLSSNQFYEVLDFYHAVEHLSKVAELKKDWSSKKSKKWVKQNRRLLLKGKVKEVISSVLSICRGSKNKKLLSEKDYFVRNQKRMQYDKIAEIGLPIGSGAMESAVRRVVNLRLKGASIYWLKETAEAMLLLRSFYKSGRWDMLKNLSFSRDYCPVV